eukprot:1235399-Prymnesium_polylepis.2
MGRHACIGRAAGRALHALRPRLRRGQDKKPMIRPHAALCAVGQSSGSSTPAGSARLCTHVRVRKRAAVRVRECASARPCVGTAREAAGRFTCGGGTRRGAEWRARVRVRVRETLRGGSHVAAARGEGGVEDLQAQHVHVRDDKEQPAVRHRSVDLSRGAASRGSGVTAGRGGRAWLQGVAAGRGTAWRQGVVAGRGCRAWLGAARRIGI